MTREFPFLAALAATLLLAAACVPGLPTAAPTARPDAQGVIATAAPTVRVQPAQPTASPTPLPAVPSPTAQPTAAPSWTPWPTAMPSTPLPVTPVSGAWDSPLPATPQAEGGEPVVKPPAVETPMTEGGLTLLPSDKGAAIQPGEPIPFVTLAQGMAEGPMPMRSMLVVAQGRDLSAAQGLLAPTVLAQAAARVDPAQHVILAAFHSGADPNSGITVRGLSYIGRNVTLVARVAPGGMDKEAVAAPGAYHIIAVNRNHLPAWNEQPLRFVLQDANGAVLARTIPPSPKDVHVGFGRLAQGIAEGRGPARMEIVVVESSRELPNLLPYIKDAAHQRAIRSVNFDQDVVVAFVRGNQVRNAFSVSLQSVRRATNWLVFQAAFSGPPAGMMLPESSVYAYDVVRLRRQDLQGWDLRPYYLFLQGNQMQQMAEARVYHEAPRRVRVRVVAQGDVLGEPFGGPGLLVASTAADLSAFIRQVDSAEQSRALRAVDFANELLVVVFGAGRPTSGYGLAYGGVELLRQDLTLTVTEERPGRGAIVAEAVHTPYLALAIPLADLPGWDERGVFGITVRNAQGQVLASTRGSITGPGKER